jgi:hypothetical protein
VTVIYSTYDNELNDNALGLFVVILLGYGFISQAVASELWHSGNFMVCTLHKTNFNFYAPQQPNLNILYRSHFGMHRSPLRPLHQSLFRPFIEACMDESVDYGIRTWCPVSVVIES